MYKLYCPIAKEFLSYIFLDRQNAITEAEIYSEKQQETVLVINSDRNNMVSDILVCGDYMYAAD